MAEWHDTTEEYLEAILEIEEEGIVPIRARLVERLGLSAPAVSETVNRLVDHGYAELLDDRSLRLTDKGREVATSIVRRHRLAERLLVDVIGLEWEKVHRRPTAGSTPSPPTSRRSSSCCSATRPRARTATRSPARATRSRVRHPCRSPQMQPGPVVVRRISEKVEIDDDAIAFLAGAELIPGSNAMVVEHAAPTACR